MEEKEKRLAGGRTGTASVQPMAKEDKIKRKIKCEGRVILASTKAMEGKGEILVKPDHSHRTSGRGTWKKRGDVKKKWKRRSRPEER